MGESILCATEDGCPAVQRGIKGAVDSYHKATGGATPNVTRLEATAGGADP